MEILRLDVLCKQYPAFRLDHVSFAMEEGTIMGLIGRNGAGKTTTLKSMLHLVHPDEGRITICGLDMDRDPDGTQPASLRPLPTRDPGGAEPLRQPRFLRLL